MDGERNYFGMTVMLDLDVLDTSNDYCEVCQGVEDGRCDACKAWVEKTGEEIEQRVYQRFPESEVIWLSHSEMGSYKAEHPDSIGCPDDIYEAVLG